MNAPTPYRPDHSLLHAVLLLTGGLLLTAGSVYLLSALSEELSLHTRAELVHLRRERAPRSLAHRARTRRSRRPVSSEPFGVRSSSVPPPQSGALPVWTAPFPNGSATSGLQNAPYDIDVDLNHAQLGRPSGASGVFLGRRGSGSGSGKTPLKVDVGGRVDAGTGTPPPWRSEVRELNRSLQTLSGALAHLNRSREKTNARGSGESVREKASPSSSSSFSDPSPPRTPEQVPVGGAGWLAAAGAAYAVNRLRRRNTGTPNEEE